MKQSTQPKFELLYFPIHGRAEVLRLTFALAQVEYTDVAVTDWATLKPQTPLGQIPVLKETSESGTWLIPQTAAILRHLGRLFGLYGSTEREHTITDYVIESGIDWRSKFTPVAYAKMYGTAQSVVDKYWAEDLAHHLKLAEMLLANSGQPFFVGASPTIADVAMWDTLDANVAQRPEVLSRSAVLAAFHQRFAALSGVDEYLKNRRPSEHRRA